ncbi:uracil-DNA glycosylase [Sphingomonas sp. PB4P5]|uniref:uracil-DNA glycosylase n=1 Tax=Parasphingomonas puruogangriensis TaxID=3096155 RepID=UPI002FC8BEFD
MLELPQGWRTALGGIDLTPLDTFLAAEAAAGKQIFPDAADRFRALALTPPDRVRVVLLGQDPYHGAGQAHGLSFSVRPGVRTPASLRNIYRELASDLGIPAAPHGFLDHWAEQGVLLLNTVLTVEAGKAGSHRKRGWEGFTDAVIAHVSAHAPPSVFMLWGNPAKEKAILIDDIAAGGRHLVLTAAHPSPLAQGKFFGSRHFSQANTFLEAHGRGAIDWALPAR